MRGELFQPGRCMADASCLCRRWVLPAQSQKQGSPTDRQCPSRQRETKPAERGAFEIELAQQGRGDDLAPRRQQTRRGEGTGSVAGEHEAGTTRQLLERGRNALVLADTCGLIGLTPRSEATGANPAGVDVRRAGMADEGDATLFLNRAFHTREGTPDA